MHHAMEIAILALCAFVLLQNTVLVFILARQSDKNSDKLLAVCAKEAFSEYSEAKHPAKPAASVHPVDLESPAPNGWGPATKEDMAALFEQKGI